MEVRIKFKRRGNALEASVSGPGTGLVMTGYSPFIRNGKSFYRIGYFSDESASAAIRKIETEVFTLFTRGVEA